jgi:hypothetical protein
VITVTRWSGPKSDPSRYRLREYSCKDRRALELVLSDLSRAGAQHVSLSHSSGVRLPAYDVNGPSSRLFGQLPYRTVPGKRLFDDSVGHTAGKYRRG